MTALGRLLLEAIDLGNISLLYLVPVMFAAATFGVRAGLFAGLASSLAYNFFFLPPTGTLTVINGTGGNIDVVSISNCDASTYGFDRLPDRNPLLQGVR